MTQTDDDQQIHEFLVSDFSSSDYLLIYGGRLWFLA